MDPVRECNSQAREESTSEAWDTGELGKVIDYASWNMGTDRTTTGIVCNEVEGGELLLLLHKKGKVDKYCCKPP